MVFGMSRTYRQPKNLNDLANRLIRVGVKMYLNDTNFVGELISSGYLTNDLKSATSLTFCNFKSGFVSYAFDNFDFNDLKSVESDGDFFKFKLKKPLYQYADANLIKKYESEIKC